VFKNKNYLQFCEIYDYKKGKTTRVFYPSFFVVVGSEIRDPGWKKSGSGINILDP
jgi:hypothetical protein